MANMAKILFIPHRHNERRPTDPSLDVRGRERRARWVVVALLLSALGLFWGGALLYRDEEQAGLRSLPAEARRGLYARTLDELQTVCRDPAAATGALGDHCAGQARFVRQLPECTDACQRAAALVLPHMRR